MSRFADFTERELIILKRGLKLIPPYGPNLEYNRAHRGLVTSIGEMVSEIDAALDGPELVGVDLGEKTSDPRNRA